jgi:hypothetical protein
MYQSVKDMCTEGSSKVHKDSPDGTEPMLGWDRNQGPGDRKLNISKDCGGKLELGVRGQARKEESETKRQGHL